MKRREFITLLGGAAAWPLPARAQQPVRVPTIGFLGQSTRSATSEWTAAFVQRLRELGWIVGRTVAIEYRWAEGHDERGLLHIVYRRNGLLIAPRFNDAAKARASPGLFSSVTRPAPPPANAASPPH